MVEEIHNSVIKETIYKKELANGLNVFVMPRNNFCHQYAVFSAGCGSIDLEYIDPVTEEKTSVPPGIAHFLEHKLFEDKEESIFNAFAALGSSTNAYTGFSRTSYLFSGTINFIDSLIRLIDFVQDPYFTEENVNREKSIITQEIKMYEDNPGWQIFFNLLQGLYKNHPVKYDIAGTEKSIRKITAEKLYSFYRTYYHPINMVLFVSGEVTPEVIFQKVEDNQLKKNFSSQKKPQSIYPDEPDSTARKKTILEMDVTRPMFSLGFKETGLKLTPEEQIKQELVTNMLLEIIIGKSSDLYRELYRDNLIDENFSSNYTLEKNYGFVKINGETSEPEELFSRLIPGLKNCEQYITEKNFRRIYKKYYGEFISSFNSIEKTASKFVNFYFRGFNLFDSLNLFAEITVQDLKKQFEKLFLKQKPVRVIIT